jgi:hypothetical protein
MFHNPFVILVIHKFCYFNLVVSLLHYNHQYHAYFDICHNLQGLIIGEHVSHLPVEVPSYIVNHQARTTPAMASGHCCRSSSAHLRRRDDATILDIVVVERARYGEYR